MGREIRRCPANWEHPKDRQGIYKPLLDGDYPTHIRQWVERYLAWERGERPEYCTDESRGLQYWEWDVGPPQPEDYRPAWPESEHTHYQVYENVTEGTPISPVFATTTEVVDWLVKQGHSRTAAEAFVEDGWAPSIVIVGNRMAMGIDAHDLMPPIGGVK